MEIAFELSESKVEGIKFYGKLILGEDDETVSIDITVREGENKDLFVCYPSKKSSKDDKYYSTVFLGSKLYEKVNKKLNKQFNK